MENAGASANEISIVVMLISNRLCLSFIGAIDLKSLKRNDFMLAENAPDYQRALCLYAVNYSLVRSSGSFLPPI